MKKLDFLLPIKNQDYIPVKAPNCDTLDLSINNIHKLDDDVIYVKTEDSDVIEILDKSLEVASKGTAKEDIQTTLKEPGIFVSNNYTNTPSTSASSSTSKEYKYGYNDIITGTFQEKLDECLAEGIEIKKTNGETEKLNQALKDIHQEMLTANEQFQEMLEFRRMLPTYKKASDLLDVINRNQVVVISGETGCGKSTQVRKRFLKLF